ncbi:hypothetical protein [Ruania albidiflava]|uniref:hypothetical protein n=1 Tax=Ruania albidiflava TaxID=366586 RepID=UPI0003B73CAC|nr:hypothetical protein [Ruania albidiflava]
MKARTLPGATVGITLVGVLALAGCSDGPSNAPDPDEAGSDAAAVFLACLTAADVEAGLNTDDQVLVKLPAEPGDGAEISSGADDDGLLGMELDEAGHLWAVAADSTYFVDVPEIQDAYATCEQEHPEFTQPHPDPGNDPEHQDLSAEQQAAALAFARCARENGFPQIADPEGDMGGAIMIPDGFSESDFRALAEACYDPGSSFAVGTSTEDLGFDPWAILEELEDAPVS